MTTNQTGKIIGLARNEKDPVKINFAVQQALERLGGKQVNRVTTASSNYSLLPSDYLVVASGGTQSLPAANDAPGQKYLIKLGSTGSVAVSVSTASTDTIDGSTSATISSQYNTIEVQSDGVDKWHITNKSVDPAQFLQVANALSELSTLATTARANLGLGSVATQNTSSVLETTNALSELVSQATTARANISAAGLSQNLQASLSVFSLASLQPIPFVQHSPVAGTLNNLYSSIGNTSSSSFKFSIQINGTDVTGGSSITTTSTAVKTSALSSANTFAVGDDIWMVPISLSGSPLAIRATVSFTYSATLT